MLIENFEVASPSVQYSEDCISSSYQYQTTRVEQDASGKWKLFPEAKTYQFKTRRAVPKLG
jgi:hypothetical protein